MNDLLRAFCVLCIWGSCATGALPAAFHRGVNHAHVHRAGYGYGSRVSARELASLRAIGVTHVALTPFGYQSRFDDDRVRFGGDRTLTESLIAAEVAAAHELGIQVTLKPHIWSGDFWRGGQWHGTIDQATPQAHAQWWADYCKMTMRWARFCAKNNVEVFCIGTELVAMTARYGGAWRKLIADVRQVYDGKLTYAAHWYREKDQIEFWDALDFVGISAYFPLDAPVGATVAQLVRAWEPHRRVLEALAQRTGKSIAFMEVGYRPVAGGHRRPWEYGRGVLDEAAQARAYEALFQALGSQRWWSGAYVWKTFTDPQHGGSRGNEFVFRELEAQRVIERWYGGRGGSGGPRQ